MKEPYCYESIPIMKNKLYIKNQKALEIAESALVINRLRQIDKKVYGEDFSVKRLQAINKYLFEPIYEWAGNFRTINVEKAEKVLNGLSVEYSDEEFIKHDAEKVIQDMNTTNWNKLPIDKIIKKFSKFFAELWQVHPFREGNSRTTLTYISQFAAQHDFPMDKKLFRLNPGYFRNSLVIASIGEYSEPQYLENIIRNAIISGSKIKQ